LVREFFSGLQSAGEYDFEWDGLDSGGFDLPSGLYFCTILSKSQFKKVKMLKTK